MELVKVGLFPVRNKFAWYVVRWAECVVEVYMVLQFAGDLNCNGLE